jgi:hypothetical protein
MKYFLLVVVNDLDLIGIAGSKYKTNTKLIVDPDAPLTRAITFEFFEPVARRNPQECDFGRCVNQKQLSSGSSHNIRGYYPVVIALEQFATQIACPSFDRHATYYP